MNQSFLSTLGPLFFFTSCFLLSYVVFIFFVAKNRAKTPEIENRPASTLVNRDYREFWFWLTNPVVKLFVFLKLTPNMITTLGIMLSLWSAYLFYHGDFGWGGWLMVFAGTFDTFDGRVARATNRETQSGAYYDAIADRIAEGAVFYALATYYYGHIGYWIMLVAFLGTVLVSYSRAKGESSGVNYSGGAMQRPERVVYIGVGGLLNPFFTWAAFNIYFMIYGTPLEMTGPDLAKWIYLLPALIVAIFTWTTSYNRITYVMKELDRKQFGG